MIDIKKAVKLQEVDSRWSKKKLASYLGKRGIKHIRGFEYWRPPTPTRDSWEKDIKRIVDMNANLIQLRPSWALCEPNPGEYSFEEIIELVDIAEKNGIYVAIQLIQEVAPLWLENKLGKSIYRLDETRTIIPAEENVACSGGLWTVCFDNPKIKKYAEGWIINLVKALKNKKNLLLWSVWNEPRSRPVECWCDASIELYRAWLKCKYGTIEDYNKFYKKKVGNFDYLKGPLGYDDVTLREFRDEFRPFAIAEWLRWMHELVKRYDKEHPTISHSGHITTAAPVFFDKTDCAGNAKQVNVYGGTLVPSGIYDGYGIDMFCANLRNVSGDAPWIIWEIYAGKPFFDNDVTPQKIVIDIFKSLAEGAKSSIIWQYSPELFGWEIGGYGLTDVDGTENEKCVALRKAFNLIKQNENLFSDIVPVKNSAAIFYDRASDMQSAIRAKRFMYLREQAIKFEEGAREYAYGRSKHSIFMSFHSLDISVDYVRPEDKVDMRQYKFVYLPANYIMTEDLAQKLKNYVKNGGILVSESAIGLEDKKGWLNKGLPYGLDRLFGCQRKPDNRILGHHVNDKIKTFGKYKGPSLKVTHVRCVLEPYKGVEILGRWLNGEAAITANNHGKGRAILFGSDPSIDYFENKNPYLPKFLKKLLEIETKNSVNRGLEITGEKKPGEITSKILQSNGKNIVFLFNYNSFEEGVCPTKDRTITLKRYKRLLGTKQIKSLTTDKTVVLKINNNDLVIRIPYGSFICLYTG